MLLGIFTVLYRIQTSWINCICPIKHRHRQCQCPTTMFLLHAFTQWSLVQTKMWVNEAYAWLVHYEVMRWWSLVLRRKEMTQRGTMKQVRKLYWIVANSLISMRPEYDSLLITMNVTYLFVSVQSTVLFLNLLLSHSLKQTHYTVWSENTLQYSFSYCCKCHNSQSCDPELILFRFVRLKSSSAVRPIISINQLWLSRSQIKFCYILFSSYSIPVFHDSLLVI